ncbi:MAG: potassium/proton antiporter [Anaerolineae bacterium]|nr:potassium/proton antiporter [Anaerolineae bacterium]
MAVELVLVVVAALLLLSIFASKAAGLLGVPSLLLFLLLGMLAGSEGIGGIAFDDAALAQAIGVVALALILFAGGLETDWDVVKPTLRSGLSLATLGVVVTAILVGFFAHAFLNFGLLEGLLLGAILSSTDAAAVFAVLRGRGVHLRGKLEPLLELEAGSNDPMAVFLTIALTSLVAQPQQPISLFFLFFLQQMILGVLGGFLIGRLGLWLINRLRLEYDGLYPVLTLALAMLTYGATAALGGNGFLAVYLAALFLGNHDFIHKKSLTRFHDGMAWLMQIAMFLSLGLLVTPSQLVPMAGMGLVVALFLMLVARPLSALVALLFSRFTLRERLMVGWVGLRGAAPIILATFPLLAGLPKADTLFNLVFFAVLASVLLQGPTIVPIARWLGVEAPQPRHCPVPEMPLKDATVEIILPPDSAAVGRQLLDVGLPHGVLVVLIGRNGQTFVPSGSTTLAARDKLLLISAPEDRPMLAQACAMLTLPAEPPTDEPYQTGQTMPEPLSERQTA